MYRVGGGQESRRNGQKEDREGEGSDLACEWQRFGGYKTLLLRMARGGGGSGICEPLEV